MTTSPTPAVTPGSTSASTPGLAKASIEDGSGQSRSRPLASQGRGRIGWVVAASLATGLVASVLLAAAPVIVAREAEIGGAVLCGFALGWAMLMVLSVRFTDQPQRWAAAPALLMGLSGALLIGFGSSIDEVLGWVVPPAFLLLAVWMVVQARRHLQSRSRRWLLYPVIAVMTLASAGAGYETVSEATDVDVAMPGRLIDVGGHRLHLNCTGTGSPTVVLQAGGGMMSSDQGWIAPAVARETRVCVYDRAGRGWSDPATTRQDAAQIAADLHTLLHRANVPGPYVLAGHSFGGLYALTSAARYPDEVAGMVLIDTTQPATEPKSVTKPESVTASDDPDSYTLASHFSALISTSARLGLGRVFAQMESSLPPQSTAEVNVGLTTASSLRSTIDEYLAAGSSVEQAAALQDFGDKPLAVLTAGIGSDATWVAGHEELATFSTSGVHRIIDGAAHATLVTEEEHAAATTQAILDVVASVRTREPLER
jgi:pimeloyl-ACP methyl ester carboxylesterase